MGLFLLLFLCRFLQLLFFGRLCLPLLRGQQRYAERADEDLQLQRFAEADHRARADEPDQDEDQHDDADHLQRGHATTSLSVLPLLLLLRVILLHARRVRVENGAVLGHAELAIGLDARHLRQLVERA